MTIVILARAKNGAILAADTQITAISRIGPKKAVSKILDIVWPPPTQINHEKADILISMAFSGNDAIISKIMTDIYTYINSENSRPADMKSFIALLEAIFFKYYRALNGEIPRMMGMMQPPTPFDVSAAVMGMYNGEPVLGKLIPEPPTFVPLIREDYIVLGSGLYYGDLLMRLLYNSEYDIVDAANVISYVISEVARIDPYVGMPATLRVLTTAEDGSVMIRPYTTDVTSFQGVIRSHLQKEFIKKLRSILDSEKDGSEE